MRQSRILHNMDEELIKKQAHGHRVPTYKERRILAGEEKLLRDGGANGDDSAMGDSLLSVALSNTAK